MSVNTKKRNSKRSRAITDIIADNGIDYWKSLTVSQKNAAIKEQKYKHKKQAKKGRKYMRDLNIEYKGIIEKGS